MDTQRLILFVVFSFSALLLWEAWQKETRPPPAAVAAPKANPATAAPDVPTAAPSLAPTAAPSAGAQVVPANVPPAANGTAGPAGRTITITTDLFRAEVDTTGGAITQVALLNHRDPGDDAKPYLALMRTPERTFVAQAGLLGDGMPNHRTVFEALPGPREFAPGTNRIELRLQATTPTLQKMRSSTLLQPDSVHKYVPPKRTHECQRCNPADLY